MKEDLTYEEIQACLEILQAETALWKLIAENANEQKIAEQEILVNTLIKSLKEKFNIKY